MKCLQGYYFLYTPVGSTSYKLKFRGTFRLLYIYKLHLHLGSKSKFSMFMVGHTVTKQQTGNGPHTLHASIWCNWIVKVSKIMKWQLTLNWWLVQNGQPYINIFCWCCIKLQANPDIGEHVTISLKYMYPTNILRTRVKIIDGIQHCTTWTSYKAKFLKGLLGIHVTEATFLFYHY